MPLSPQGRSLVRPRAAASDRRAMPIRGGNEECAPLPILFLGKTIFT